MTVKWENKTHFILSYEGILHYLLTSYLKTWQIQNWHIQPKLQQKGFKNSTNQSSFCMKKLIILFEIYGKDFI